MRKSILLLLVLLLTPAVQAKDLHDQFAVFGAGAQTCERYLDARSLGGRAMQPWDDWIAGYLSAFNLIVEKTHNILGNRSYADAVRWLDQRCRADPDEVFVNAMANLTENLYPERRSFVKSEEPWGTAE